MDNIPEWLKDAIKNVKLENDRPYQTFAIINALKMLNNENVEINLPPGTGKTLISQAISILWLKEKPGSKVLFVLPSTTLLDQHYEYCCFWAKYQSLCNPLRIDSEWVNSSITHSNFFNKRDLWFTLPGLFNNICATQLIEKSILNKISLIVIDEYDAFSLGILRAEGISMSFNKPFFELMEKFNTISCRYLLLSATPEL